MRRAIILGVAVGLAGCGSGSADRCERRAGDPAFAVVLTDYFSTAIGLLDEAGDTLTECWVDSGTRSPGLVAAFSGDVVLATRQPQSELAVIDRFPADVFSRVSLITPTVVGQVRVQDQSASASFSANPHDAVIAGPSSVWVTRFGANLDPDAAPLARGSDLVEIDPTTFALTGNRISLEPFIVPVTVATDDGPVTRPAYPRPSRAVRVGSTVVVGLGRFTSGFDAVGPGAVAVVHLATRSATLHNLADGVANCGRVVPVPASPDLVVVGCIGFSRPFGVEADVRATSGIFVLRVDGGDVTTVRSWRPSADAGTPLPVAEVAALDPTTVVAVDYGDPGNDRAFLVNLETGSATLLFESSAFQIGAGVFTPPALLLMPDADVGVRRFVRTDETFSERTPVAIDGGVGLPPRSIYSLE